jgi:hypothetical protein
MVRRSPDEAAAGGLGPRELPHRSPAEPSVAHPDASTIATGAEVSMQGREGGADRPLRCAPGRP